MLFAYDLPFSLTNNFLAVTENIGARYKEATGAKIRGFILKALILQKKYKGAQNPSYMKDPSMEEFRAWQKAANGLLNKIALAPERRGRRLCSDHYRRRGDCCFGTLQCNF